MHICGNAEFAPITKEIVEVKLPSEDAVPPTDNSEEYIESYRVLGLQGNESAQKIKQAYLDLVKVWHPDRFSENERLRRLADAKLKEINIAYECIKANLKAPSESPVSTPTNGDLAAAILSVTKMMNEANEPLKTTKALLERVKAGSYAEHADALQAVERIIAGVEEVLAYQNEVFERVRREAPGFVSNADFIRSQQWASITALEILVAKLLIEQLRPSNL